MAEKYKKQILSYLKIALRNIREAKIRISDSTLYSELADTTDILKQSIKKLQ